jgi:hypothetical protein
MNDAKEKAKEIYLEFFTIIQSPSIHRRIERTKKAGLYMIVNLIKYSVNSYYWLEVKNEFEKLQ